MDKSSESLQSTCNKGPSLDVSSGNSPSFRKKTSERYWQDGQPVEKCLLHMYENKLWTDVSFRCKGNVVENTADRILAHKNISAARSPDFEAMLFGRLAKDEIDLGYIEADIFDLVLRFVYSDETTLSNENADRVLEVAHMYQLTALVAYCTTYLHSMLQPDNACEMLDIALYYDLKKFAAKVHIFIDDNAADILRSDGFISVSQQCLTRMLKRDTFYAGEKDIVERTMQWADRKCAEEKLEATGENKRQVLGDAFFEIRMTTLQAKDFLQFTRRNNYYTKDESEDICSKIVGEREVAIFCHNPVHRIPRRCERQVPDKAIADPALNVYDIQCVVEAQVSRQTYIKGVTLKNVQPIIGRRKMEFGYKEPDRLANNLALPLTSKLIVEGCTSVIFKAKPWKSSRVSFKKALCINPREKPYGIVLMLTYNCNNQIGFNELRNQSNSREKVAMSTTQESGIADIRFIYSDTSKHVNYVEFRCN